MAVSYGETTHYRIRYHEDGSDFSEDEVFQPAAETTDTEIYNRALDNLQIARDLYSSPSLDQDGLPNLDVSLQTVYQSLQDTLFTQTTGFYTALTAPTSIALEATGSGTTPVLTKFYTVVAQDATRRSDAGTETSLEYNTGQVPLLTFTPNTSATNHYIYRGDTTGVYRESITVTMSLAAIAAPTLMDCAALAAPTPVASSSGGTLATGTYYYKITAISTAGVESVGGAEASVAVTGPTGSVSLTWTARTGAASYRIYRGTSAGAENVYYTSATNSYTDTNAASTGGSPPSSSGGTLGTATYFYTITALDANGVESVPSVETSVTLTGTTGKVAVSWTAKSGASSYRIYRGTTTQTQALYYTSATNSYTDTNASSTAGSPQFGFAALSGGTFGAISQPVTTALGALAGQALKVATTTGFVVGQAITVVDTYSFAIPRLSSVTATPTTGGSLATGTYSYRVTAYNAYRESLPSPAITVDITNPNKATVSWYPVPDAQQYRIYRTDPDGTEYRVVTTAGTLSAGILSYADDGVATEATGSPEQNFYRVSAVNISTIDTANKLITITPVTDTDLYRNYTLILGLEAPEADFGSNIMPLTDNTLHIGSDAYRWHTLHLGPGSLKLYSTTGTGGATSNHTLGALSFSTTKLVLATSAVGSGGTGTIQITTGANTGLNVDASGRVGVQKAVPTEALDVTGNIAASGNVAVGGNVTVTGTITSSSVSSSTFAGQILTPNGSPTAPAIAPSSAPSSTGIYFASGADVRIAISGAFAHQFTANTWSVNSDTAQFAWGTAGDLKVVRDAANTLAQRNSTNAQTFRIYNTYTDASNYERGEITWLSNIFGLYTRSAGTGVARAMEVGTIGSANLSLLTAGSIRWIVNTSGHLIPNSTYDFGTTSNRVGTVYTGALDASGQILTTQGGNSSIQMTGTGEFGLLWNDSASGVQWDIWNGTSGTYGGGWDNHLLFHQRNNGSGVAGVVAALTPNRYFSVNNRLGIGLGTTEPSYTLDVSGQVRTTGNVGVGSAPISNAAIYSVGAVLSGSPSQYGIHIDTTHNSAATTEGVGGYFRVTTQATTFTMATATSIRAANPSKGAGSTITTSRGVYVEAQTSGGTSNYGLYIEAPSGGSTNNIGLYNAGTSKLDAHVTVTSTGTDADAAQFQVKATADTNKRIALGFNSTGNYGTLYATQDGSSRRPIVISGNHVVGGEPGGVSISTTSLPTNSESLLTGGAIRVLTGGVTITAGGLRVTAGNVGLGNAPQTHYGLYTTGQSLSGSAQQRAVFSDSTFGSDATTGGYAFTGRVQTTATAYTMSEAIAYLALSPTKGAGSTITSSYGVYVQAQVAGGTNNYGVYIEAPSGGSSSNVGLHNEGTTTLVGALTAGAGAFSGTITLSGGPSIIQSSASALVLQSAAQVWVNLDSDNNSTGAYFVVGRDRSTNSGGTDLFTVNEDGTIIGGTYNGQTISSTASFTGTVSVAGKLTTQGALVRQVNTYTSNQTLSATANDIVRVDASGGAVTITLPTAVGNTGLTYTVKRIDGTLANAVALNTTSSQTIDGVTSWSFPSQYYSLTVVSNGTNWDVI